MSERGNFRTGGGGRGGRGNRGGRGGGEGGGGGGDGSHHHHHNNNRGGGDRGGRGGGGGGAGHSNTGAGTGSSGEKPKKENILDLAKYMDKEVNVKFNGGREGSFFFPIHFLSIILPLPFP